MIRSGPHQTMRSNRELMQMLALNCRLGGQLSGDPSGLSDQSRVRISAPISPPATSQGMRFSLSRWAGAPEFPIETGDPLAPAVTASIAPSRLRERSALATYPEAPTS